MTHRQTLVLPAALGTILLAGCPSDPAPPPGTTPATTTPATAAPATAAPSTAAPSTAAPATAEPAAPAPAPAPAPAAGNGGGMQGDSHAHMVQTDLGELVIEGSTLKVRQFGEIAAKDALAADVTGDIPDGAALFAWLADAKGEPLGATSDSDKSDGKWHFHLMQDDDEADPVWLYLRIRGGGIDARGRLLLDGAEEPPPHNGSVGGFTPAGDEEAVDPVGTVEAVWDPKTGTVSIWVYMGKGFGTAAPLDAEKGVIAIIDEAPVEFTVKDAAAGHAVAEGQESLKDEDLTPFMTLTFTSGGKEYTTEPMLLEVK